MLNVLQFDPKVTITGVNNDMMTEMQNSSVVESTVCKSYLLESAQQTERSIEDKDIVCGLVGLEREDSLLHD